MQQQPRSVLCRSEQGSLTVLHHGLAYSFAFKSIRLLLTADEVDVFRQSLENLDERDWIASSEASLVLLPVHRFNACVLLTRPEVNEMIELLREASAMVKVHQRLFNRV